jgi:cysteine-rich repeat protein
VIDCTVIAQCATCDYTTFTRCLTCNTGYEANPGGANTCDTKCGDGLRLGAEACDDGNNNNGDGCSSTCTAESAFFCVDGAVTGGIKSTCTACMSFCLTCTATTTCSTCQTDYAYTNNACVIDCTPISLCSTCDYPGFLNCLSCSTGYYPNSNECQPRCGDNILASPEACDDGNTNNNDGCSSSCVLEAGFLCTNGATSTTCVPCLANCVDCTGNANDCQ